MLRALILASLCLVPLLSAFGQPAEKREYIYGAELMTHAERARYRDDTARASGSGEARRGGDYYNPAFTRQEVEDLVAWLNRNFYKFAE